MAWPVVSSLVALARIGISLRWRLLSNRLRRSGKRTRRFMIVAAGGYTMVTVVVLGRARFTAEDAAAETLTLLMASMALGWVFGPVLIGGVDETIDPTKLALLPMSSTERYVVQLAAAYDRHRTSRCCHRLMRWTNYRTYTPWYLPIRCAPGCDLCRLPYGRCRQIASCTACHCSAQSRRPRLRRSCRRYCWRFTLHHGPISPRRGCTSRCLHRSPRLASPCLACPGNQCCPPG